MNPKTKLAILTLAFLIAIFNFQSALAQVSSEEILTYRAFGELLIKTMGVELPEGAEILPEDEYYEVIANIFAERGVNDFKENAPDDMVTRAGMANVLYALSGATEELSPDEKMDYLIENGYMPKGFLDSSVTFVEGDVLIFKNDTRKWEEPSPGDSLQDGDKVKTLTGARAKLQFSAGGKIMLKEHTTVTINQVDSNGPEEGGSTELYLSQGELKALVKRLQEGSTFEIKTPTAVCGIRGTTFYFKVDEEGNSETFVEDGGVSLSSTISDESQNVGEDTASVANNEGEVTPPEGLTPEEIKKWMMGYENIQNLIPVTFNEGVEVLNNPALATALAEAYSGPGGAAATIGAPGPTGEGLETPPAPGAAPEQQATSI